MVRGAGPFRWEPSKVGGVERTVIRPLTDEDRRQAHTLLNAAPEYNLYMLGNMEALGFACEFCQFWGDFAGDGRLRAVLNRYMSGWVIYGAADADWSALGRIVDAHPTPATRLQDNPGGVASFLPYLQAYEASSLSRQTLMSLNATHFTAVSAPAAVVVRRATDADFAALVAFYADAEQMTRSPAAIEQPLQRGRIWLATEAGAIVSAALTNAETSQSAMIGGVFTPPPARGRGLSQAVCSALCQELLADGKRPVLYWDTPAAGAVYRRVGFRAIGAWRSVRLAQSTPG